MSNPEFAALAHELREAAHVYAADGDAAARYGAAYMALMDARPRDLADMATQIRWLVYHHTEVNPEACIAIETLDHIADCLASLR